jgi:hypothetical protein
MQTKSQAKANSSTSIPWKLAISLAVFSMCCYHFELVSSTRTILNQQQDLISIDHTSTTHAGSTKGKGKGKGKSKVLDEGRMDTVNITGHLPGNSLEQQEAEKTGVCTWIGHISKCCCKDDVEVHHYEYDHIPAFCPDPNSGRAGLGAVVSQNRAERWWNLQAGLQVTVSTKTVRVCGCMAKCPEGWRHANAKNGIKENGTEDGSGKNDVTHQCNSNDKNAHSAVLTPEQIKDPATNLWNPKEEKTCNENKQKIDKYYATCKAQWSELTAEKIKMLLDIRGEPKTLKHEVQCDMSSDFAAWDQ